jgi:hypothetical protein
MFKKISLLVFYCFLFFNVMAQPGGGGDPGGGEPVPIQGVIILLIAGGALGVKKFLKRQQ